MELYGELPRRLYAEAFWLTDEARESGRGGIAGEEPVAVDMDEGADKEFWAAGMETPDVVGDGAAIVAAELVAPRSHGLGGEAIRCT